MSTLIAEASIARISNDAKTLQTVRDTGVSIALWERELPVSITRLSLADVGNIQFTTNARDLRTALNRALDDAGYDKSSDRGVLAGDVKTLADHFLKAIQARSVEIRMEKITTDACRKFHADYVTARLITTYQGQGTQWLDSDGLDSDGAADCDCGDPHNIQQMRTGDVALFKGRLWSKDSPAIHRSPPIAGTGEERLVLVMNPGDAR